MAARHPYKRGEVVLRDELLVAAITSKSPKTTRSTDCVLLNWKTAGLHQPSWVRSHTATVQRSLIMKKIGDLTAGDLQAVEKCLRISMGL